MYRNCCKNKHNCIYQEHTQSYVKMNVINVYTNDWLQEQHITPTSPTRWSVTNSLCVYECVLIHYWRGTGNRSSSQLKEKCTALSTPRQEKALRDLWQHDAYFRRNKKRKKKKTRNEKEKSSTLEIPWQCEESVPACPFKVDLENHLRRRPHSWNL